MPQNTMNSISTRLLIILISAAATVITLLGLLEYHAGQLDIQHHLNADMRIISNRLTISLRKSIYEYDIGTLKDTVQAEFQESALDSVFVWTQGGEQLLCGLKAIDGKVVQVNTPPPPVDYILTNDYPIYSKQGNSHPRIGQLSISLDRRPAEARLMRAMFLELTKIGTTIILLLGIMVYFLKHYLTNPLDDLSQSMIEANHMINESDDWAHLAQTPPQQQQSVFPEIVKMHQIYYELLGHLVERQQSIHRQKERLKTTFNSIGDAIITTDEKGMVAKMNPVAEKLTGRNAVEARGKPLAQIFTTVDTKTRAPLDSPFIRIIENHKPNQRSTLLAANGDEYQISESAALLRDTSDHIIGSVLVFRDITEDYQMIRAIEAERTRSQNIIKGTHAGTWDWNIRIGEFVLNERWAGIMGRTLAELNGFSEDVWKAYIHEDDLPSVKEALQTHLAGETAYYDVQYRQAHKDGNWVWVHSRGKVTERSEAGKPLRMSGTHLDITQIKESEAQLINAKNEAEEANSAKDEFLAVMSHEMRTPLNPIMGFSELMLASTSDQTEITYLNAIISAAKRQLRLIDGILDFMRLNRNDITLTPEPFNLVNLCQLTVNDAQTKAEHLELKFENGSHYPSVPDDLVIECDMIVLRRILDNLIDNACKYTEKGSVTLSVGQDTTDAQTCYVLSVRDTGMGIAKDLHSKLFDAFKQADSSYTRRYEGVGLGLSICKKLTQILGGSISLESEPEIGSCFTIRLPLNSIQSISPSSDETDKPMTIESRESLAPFHVLICEDRDDNLLFAQTLVTSFGCEVSSARDGAEAIKICQDTSFDVILMDLAMPVMNGLEASKQIRESENPNQHTPIIAVTADINPIVKTACASFGIEYYISKPIDSGSLYRTMSELRAHKA